MVAIVRMLQTGPVDLLLLSVGSAVGSLGDQHLVGQREHDGDHRGQDERGEEHEP